MSMYKPDSPESALAFIARYKISLDYFAGEWTATYEKEPETCECCGHRTGDIISADGEEIASVLEDLYKEMVNEGVI